MSPSPTGPGSWMRANTLAERETGGERTGAQCRRESFAERFHGGLALSAARGKPQRSEASYLLLRRPRNGLGCNFLQRIRN
jgi:hypothetical protein